MTTTAPHQHETHDPYLAHHFETPRQQYESGKLGMWLFLSTEILLFGGLFCAYAVYRANHPEIFVYAHQFLDKNLGGLNTIILICSSFTMAWAVRAAQLGDKKKQVALLTATLLFAGAFLGVKAVEYNEKWKHGLLWGRHYKPQTHEVTHAAPGSATPGHMGDPTQPVGSAAAAGAEAAPVAGEPGAATPAGAHGAAAEDAAQGGAAGAEHAAAPAGAQAPAEHAAAPGGADRPLLAPASIEPKGLAVSAPEASRHDAPQPKNVQIFFGIYFVMTGLHGVHVIAGMIAIAWILIRATKGHFGPRRFLPVDNVGLYWHVVDIIWIYLFPLLYLIS